jgi:hypothetical protein
MRDPFRLAVVKRNLGCFASCGRLLAGEGCARSGAAGRRGWGCTQRRAPDFSVSTAGACAFLHGTICFALHLCSKCMQRLQARTALFAPMMISFDRFKHKS